MREVGRTKFVDLNYDVLHRVKTTTRLTGLTKLWLPATLLAAEALISMPKIRTHHWAGVTLSMKRLFRVVPVSVYGWPRNFPRWQGIDNSIVELASTVLIHYVIADGIVGNSPLYGGSGLMGLHKNLRVANWRTN